MAFKILDGTLRDGGYYTNWDFEPKLVAIYLDSLNKLPIDYLEVGYRSDAKEFYLGEFFYCPIPVLKKIRQQITKKIAIIINERDIEADGVDDLLKPISSLVDMVRIAVDPANFERALQIGNKVKSLGFELSFNLMYMSNWINYPELLSHFKKLDGLADYLYMVDSHGSVYPEQVVNTIILIREETNVKLGFHGHNNIEMGLANSLAAIAHGVDIIDSTILGMGRGAGNLKTELLLTVLNAKGLLSVDFNTLSKVTESFGSLQEKYKWGTNLPYMVSGAYSLPQKQVMEWVTKRFYSFNSIIRALGNQSQGIKDNKKLPQLEFRNEMSSDCALIIGGGPSAVHHAKAIEVFVEKNKAVIIHASTRNAMSYSHFKTKQYFCLVGNEGHRMEEVFSDFSQVKGVCILPPYPREMGTYIPQNMEDRAYELKGVDFVETLQDTHTTLAIQTARELGMKTVYFVGYDGYADGNMGKKEQEIFRENEYLFHKAKKAGMQCISLTATSYSNLKKDSIYSKI